jgi:hypothetical protein
MSSDCWSWTAAKSSGGYGSFAVGTRAAGTIKMCAAHRVAYTALVGEIPDGMQIDHLCRNRACVNPSHLEAVTGLTNVRRGLKGVLTTHCRRGHALEGENVRTQHTGLRVGKRQCRECGNQREREYYRAEMEI